jgi:hypothetical protein
MKPRTTIGLSLAWTMLIMHASPHALGQIALELDLERSHHVLAKALPGGGYEITTTGNDPYIHSKPLKVKYDPNKQIVLAFEYFCAKGLSDIQLFFGDPATAKVNASGPEVLASEGWSSYALNIRTQQEPGSWRGGYKHFRLDLGRDAGRTIQLRNIQLREPTAKELELERNAARDKQRIAFFDTKLKGIVSAQHKASIERIEATEKKLRITVNLPESTGTLTLCEVPLYQSLVDRQQFIWQQPLASKSGKQTIEIDRIRDGHDRVFSSFVLMGQAATGPVPVSHQRFVDQMPAKWSLKRDRPKSKKGMSSGSPLHDLQMADYRALGIHNATRNIVTSRLVQAEANDNTFTHQFNDTTIHIDRTAVKHLDRSLMAMRDLDVVVSAIILIPKNTPMSHPDCAPQGIYAMANVVEPKGWNIYAAGLDFLARRYMRPDRKYGRITHWIMHNEVDAGWVWTNAGDKPMDSYLDLYYRSMRTAQSVIRRYGDAGSVLISLTHHWTTAHNSKCYAPRDMLDLLAKRSAAEGDFNWGIAYHPYPQNLRDPRTWLDKKITYNFDTPLITPKNLEVLDAFVKQPSMLRDGKVRVVVLSEQGSNSPKHDEASYRDQAASVVYTWLKFENLTSIESYVMHRWMDHPREGGLNLGLRTYGKTAAQTRTKPAWDIYRKLGTPAQAQAVEWARTVIPQQYFEDIPAKVEQ